jgi:hypothetical protein
VVLRLTITPETLAQDPLTHGAQPLERSVAPDIVDRRAGLQTPDAQPVDGKIHDLRGALGEQARAPARSSQRKPPFGRLEARVDRPDLKNADSRIEAVWNDPKRQMAAGPLRSPRPADELQDCLRCGRPGRQEPLDILVL